MQNSEALFTPWFCLPVEGQLPGSYLPSLRGSLWSHKARPTMLHLGYKWALYFSDRVSDHYFFCLSIYSLCWGAGQRLALCPAWRGEQRHCLLPVDKQRQSPSHSPSPASLLSLCCSPPVISNQRSQRTGSFSTPSQRPWRTTPGQNDLSPSSERSVPLIYPLSYAALNHHWVLLSKSLACLEGRDQVLFIIVSTTLPSLRPTTK